MVHYNTILSQVTSLINRQSFDYFAKVHHLGQDLELIIAGVQSWEC